jgi:hypothetical protein
LITDTWAGTSDPDEALVRDTLLRTIEELSTSPAAWRTTMLDQAPVPTAHAASSDPQAPVGVDPASEQGGSYPLAEALELSRLTAADGRQRALDLEAQSLEHLQSLRLEVRNAIRENLADPALRHVLPWLWAAASSGGQAMTGAGSTSGYELRLSRYSRPVS